MTDVHKMIIIIIIEQSCTELISEEFFRFLISNIQYNFVHALHFLSRNDTFRSLSAGIARVFSLCVLRCSKDEPIPGRQSILIALQRP